MPENNAMLPMGLLLMGVAGVCAFMAFRPWPSGSSGSGAIRPGTYFVEILQGKPPATSTPYGGSAQQQTDIAIIQGGLMAIFTVWAISKITKFLSGMPGIPASGGGGEGGSPEAEGEAAGEGEGEGEGEGGGILGDIEQAAGDAAGDI